MNAADRKDNQMETNDKDNKDKVEIRREELEQIVEEQECSVSMKTSLRKLVESFPSVECFRHADDAELRRHGRCGAGMMEMITKIRDRCFFLEKNREERFRYKKSFAEFLDERDRRQAREIDRLNSVFTVNDLQAAALYMSEEKVEFIDLRTLNEFRHAMTTAQREKMKKRYEEQEAERERLVAEVEKRLEEKAGKSLREVEHLFRTEAEQKETKKRTRTQARKGRPPKKCKEKGEKDGDK